MIRGRQRTENASASPSARPRKNGRLLTPALAAGTALSFLVGYQVQQRLNAVSPGAHLTQQSSEVDVAYSGGKPPTSGGKGGSVERPEDAAAAFQTFQSVYDLVREHYVDALPSDRLLSYGTARAMLKQLGDPNCFFLEPGQTALFEDEGKGRFGGIGAALFVRAIPRDGYSDSRIVIVAPVPGSPAAKAGLRPGDIITHIDGKWILGADPYLRYNRLVQKAEAQGADAGDDTDIRKEEVTARHRVQGGIGLVPAQLVLRGDTKTLTQMHLPADKLTLTVERPGSTAPLKFVVSPSATEAPPPSVRTLSGGNICLKVAALTDKTAEQFRSALASVKSPPAGIVLDLRGCAGGAGGGFPPALDAAESIASTLMPAGSDRTFGSEVLGGGKSATLRAVSDTTQTGPEISPHPPVVVLVDRGTAAAAEALAAALSAKGAATLEGTRTFGDPYVQSLIRLKDGSGCLLTTGRLYGPNKTDWAANGLTPRVPVAANAPESVVLAQATTALKAMMAARVALSQPSSAPNRTQTHRKAGATR